MAILTREADLATDRTLLIREIRAHLNPLADDRRFDWLYLKNPHGQARIWIASDLDSGDIVGTCAALPRLFYIRGQEEKGCVFADFWVHPNYRSLGPALQLQRACMSIVGGEACAIAYDFPRLSMAAVYKRLGVQVYDSLVRHSKVVRANRILSSRIGSPTVVRPLSLVANLGLDLLDRWRSNLTQCDVSLERDSCGEEYSELARCEGSTYELCVARTADYLNWRYCRHFKQRHEIIAARQGRKLLAYLVFIDHGDVGQVVDFLGGHDENVASALVSGLVAELRSRGTLSINVSLLTMDTRVSSFYRMGFRPRESSPLVIFDPARIFNVTAGHSPARTMFMYGDEAD